MPRSPSMKVILLLHDPVLAYPGSSVTAPDWARSCEMSMATSFSVPTVVGSWYSLPFSRSVACVMIFSPGAAQQDSGVDSASSVAVTALRDGDLRLGTGLPQWAQ